MSLAAGSASIRVRTLSRYGYDAANRMTQIGTALAGQTVMIVQSIGYRADGLPLSLHYGNGLTETRDYDAQGRLKCGLKPPPSGDKCQDPK